MFIIIIHRVYIFFFAVECTSELRALNLVVELCKRTNERTRKKQSTHRQTQARNIIINICRSLCAPISESQTLVENANILKIVKYK